ncbi:MAG: hypothetical protein ACLSA9_10180 [Anaerovoracaceae bacterium]
MENPSRTGGTKNERKIEMICDNIAVSKEGRLVFAGCDTVDLAHKYGTPLYLLDENKIREKCRIYKEAFKKTFRRRFKTVICQ